MWLYIRALIRFPAVVSVLCHAHGQPPSFSLLWPPTKLIPALFNFQGETQNESLVDVASNVNFFYICGNMSSQQFNSNIFPSR